MIFLVIPLADNWVGMGWEWKDGNDLVTQTERYDDGLDKGGGIEWREVGGLGTSFGGRIDRTWWTDSSVWERK